MRYLKRNSSGQLAISKYRTDNGNYMIATPTDPVTKDGEICYTDSTITYHTIRTYIPVPQLFYIVHNSVIVTYNGAGITVP